VRFGGEVGGLVAAGNGVAEGGFKSRGRKGRLQRLPPHPTTPPKGPVECISTRRPHLCGVEVVRAARELLKVDVRPHVHLAAVGAVVQSRGGWGLGIYY